jgi:hypothetical protein
MRGLAVGVEAQRVKLDFAFVEQSPYPGRPFEKRTVISPGADHDP